MENVLKDITKKLANNEKDFDLQKKSFNKFSGRLKEHLQDNKKMLKSLDILGKKYRELNDKNLLKVPTDMRSLFKKQSAKITVVNSNIQKLNEKVNKIGYTTRGLAKRKNTSANFRGSSKKNSRLLIEIRDELSDIKKYFKDLSITLTEDPLKNKEKNEDFERMLSKILAGQKTQPETKAFKFDKSSKGNLSDLLSSLIIPALLGADLASGLNKSGSGQLAKAVLANPFKLGKVPGQVNDVKKFFGSKVVEEGAEKGIEKVAEKELAEEAPKVLGRTAKYAGKGIKSLGKVGGKVLPGIGLGIALKFARDRFKEGDNLGAGAEIVSGVASLFPGLGTAASLFLDAGLVARDVALSSKSVSKEQKELISAISSSEKLLNSLQSQIDNSVDDVEKLRLKILKEYTLDKETERLNQIKYKQSREKLDEYKSSTPGMNKFLDEEEKYLNQQNPEDLAKYKDSDRFKNYSQGEQETILKSGLFDIIESRKNIENSKSESKKMEAKDPTLPEKYNKEKEQEEFAPNKEYLENLKNEMIEYIKIRSKYEYSEKDNEYKDYYGNVYPVNPAVLGPKLGALEDKIENLKFSKEGAKQIKYLNSTYPKLLNTFNQIKSKGKYFYTEENIKDFLKNSQEKSTNIKAPSKISLRETNSTSTAIQNRASAVATIETGKKDTQQPTVIVTNNNTVASNSSSNPTLISPTPLYSDFDSRGFSSNLMPRIA